MVLCGVVRAGRSEDKITPEDSTPAIISRQHAGPFEAEPNLCEIIEDVSVASQDVRSRISPSANLASHAVVHI
jgi:hypothetical protein